MDFNMDEFKNTLLKMRLTGSLDKETVNCDMFFIQSTDKDIFKDLGLSFDSIIVYKDDFIRFQSISTDSGNCMKVSTSVRELKVTDGYARTNVETKVFKDGFLLSNPCKSVYTRTYISRYDMVYNVKLNGESYKFSTINMNWDFTQYNFYEDTITIIIDNYESYKYCNKIDDRLVVKKDIRIEINKDKFVGLHLCDSKLIWNNL